ncbi:MAG TPA: aldo/keto reductase [Wenzhouxiangella sp.]|nr:aldo/keto reductase [Wenzhouxiangella sp.]
MSDIPVIAVGGANMPALGFGTFELTESTINEILPRAIDLGYRHIDTAQIYRNEAAVGQCIARSGIPRRDFFLTTKVWVDHYEPEAFMDSVRRSLDRLKTDHVDLLLLHWPKFSGHGMNPTLEALMRARRDGLTRHIGLSNFNIDQTEQAVAFCGDGQLTTSQVEYHIYLGQNRLRRVLARNNLILTAYMPLARALTVNEPVLWDIGDQYNKTAAQVALRWLVEQDRVAAIPSTSNPHHAAANLAIFDFQLSDADRQRIAGLDKQRRLCKPEGLAPEWDD